ncbi:tumor necrosis factor ligand superfamily member 14-like [Phyllobates terribilis]|uniref:tumor necrosis factor ligand superfamily member 14-like n=1 Tax=Phyllobates terribilis TaxID=111132 RepID=UPI003CCAE510
MDRYGRLPMSVFTVEDHVQQPPLVRKKTGRGMLLIQLVLLLFSVLALCGAASEIYFLVKVESSLGAAWNTTQENNAQKMISRSGFRDGHPMPSAHVTGLVVGDDSPSVSLQWEHSRGLAFLHEVGYNNGSLVCSKSGLYFVYSKLQLGLSKCPQKTENLLFTHRVLKRSSAMDIPVIENIRRFCDSQGSSVWRGSSFLGGSVMLTKGDEVFVSMSHKNLIRVQEDTITFFGMFMVSEV